MKEQGIYLAGNACKQLYFSNWPAIGQARAVVAMVHGYGEHAGRYQEWAERFNKQGIAFCVIDLAGHGRSSGKRGHFKSYDLVLKDIDVLLSKVIDLYPSLPVILYGHSMGGNLVINYALRRRRCFNLLIVTSPWLTLTTSIPFYTLKFIELMSHILPSLTLRSPLNVNDLSSVNQVAIDYVNDPLNHNKISMRLLWQVIMHGKNAIGQVYRITVPMFLAHGSDDNITSYKSSLEFVRNTSECISYRIYEGMKHELHHDTCQDKHFEIIMEWIDLQLPLVKLC